MLRASQLLAVQYKIKIATAMGLTIVFSKLESRFARSKYNIFHLTKFIYYLAVFASCSARFFYYINSGSCQVLSS